MQRQFTLMIILLLVLATAGALMFSDFKQNKRNSTIVKQRLLATFDEGFSRAKHFEPYSLRIMHQDQIILDAIEEDGKWFTKHLDASLTYPLIDKDLIALMRNLAQANIVEYKSNKVQHHGILGLEDASTNNPNTFAVSIVTKDGKTVDLLVGNTSSVQQGQYVRIAGQNQMLLIDTILPLPSHHTTWLAPELLNINVQNVVDIDISGAKKMSDALEHGSAQEEVELSDIGEYASYIDAINAMHFTDISVFDAQKWALLQNIAKLSIILNKGEIIRVSLANSETETYLHVESEGEYANLKNWMFTIPDYQIDVFVERSAAPE